MTAAYIICEYNPFHGGHAHHIDITKKTLQPDALVCVMSGHFTQRGSAAIADKWSRARMALYAGADLVLELHPVYACSSAESFARGALLTASSLGVGGWLSFGAEFTDLSVLKEFSNILNAEPEGYKSLIGVSLKKGLSFAAARQEALAGYYLNMYPGALVRDKISYERLCSILKAPNNILAVEYMRAIDLYKPPLAPFAVPRERNGGGMRRAYYGASDIRDAIRRIYDENYIDLLYGGGACIPDDQSPDAIYEDEQTIINFALPAYSKALLTSEFSLGRGPVFDDAFFSRVVTMIYRDGAQTLNNYKDVGEGLEHRFLEAARSARRYDELIDKAATRRYPKSRIRRILTQFMLGYDGAVLNEIKAGDGPPYLRVLGFSDTGRKLLAQSKPMAQVITNYKKLARADRRSQAFMRLESKATDIYVSAFQNPQFHTAGQDYIRGPARI